MSKAYLEMEMPQCCGDCELCVEQDFSEYEHNWICAKTKNQVFPCETERDEECPLKTENLFGGIGAMINVKDRLPENSDYED